MSGMLTQCILVEFALGSDLIQVFQVMGYLKVDLDYPLFALVSDLDHPLWVVWMASLLLTWFAPCFVSPVI
jgi:hypothetical protein